MIFGKPSFISDTGALSHITDSGVNQTAFRRNDNGDWDTLIVPNHYAHGYECLSKNSTIIYYLDNYRNIKGENGILYNDKNLKIKWKTKHPIISKRDQTSNSFYEFKKKI